VPYPTYTRRTDEPRLRPHLGTHPSGGRARGPDLASSRLRCNRLGGGHHRRRAHDHDHSNDNSHRSVGDICGAYLYLGFTAGRPAGYRPGAQRGPTFPCRGQLPCTASGQRRTTGSRLHTPGAVDPHVTDATLESTVCRRGGYTSTVRPPTSVTNSEKRLAQAAYGQSDGPSAYELDHLVPLELGGTPNSAANLWPEPGSSPNAKDKLEGALHDLLCAHRITLTAAQHMIATDWITAYRQILGTPPPG